MASGKGRRVCKKLRLQHRKEEATPYPQIHTSGLGGLYFYRRAAVIISYILRQIKRDANSSCLQISSIQKSGNLGKCKREVWFSLTSSTNWWKMYCWVSLRPWQSLPTPSQPSPPREEIDFISHFTLHLFCLPQRKAPTQWHKRHQFYLLPIYLCLCVPLSCRKANQCGNPADWDCSMKLAQWMQAQ